MQETAIVNLLNLRGYQPLKVAKVYVNAHGELLLVTPEPTGPSLSTIIVTQEPQHSVKDPEQPQRVHKLQAFNWVRNES